MTDSIVAFLDIAKACQETWGAYIKLEGWAFVENSTVAKVEAWVENITPDSLVKKGKTAILTYGSLRSDVADGFGAVCPSPLVGYQGFLPLSKEQTDGEILTLCIGITSATGSTRELRQPFAVTDTAPRAATPSELSALTDAPARLVAPNLFILGAAKCGTTSLHYTLSQHPEIFLSSIKEPSFFTHVPLFVKNPIEYFNLFPYQSGKKYYGEASHANFSSPEAAPILRQLFPDAKFLLILRDPVKRAYALYQHQLRYGKETIKSFEEALEEEERRFHDGRFRDHSSDYFWNYMYVRSSRYDLQLERYRALFPLEQFFVFTLGEWKSDPQGWLRKIFSFLDVDSEIQVCAEPKNQAPEYPPMSDSTHHLLTEKFFGVRERVEAFIGRRFDHWDY